MGCFLAGGTAITQAADHNLIPALSATTLGGLGALGTLRCMLRRALNKDAPAAG